MNLENMRNLKVYKSVDKVPSDTNIIYTLLGYLFIKEILKEA